MKKVLFPMIALAVMLTSCRGTSDSEIEAVPFKETESSLWSMITLEGKVLFEEEFKNEPTMVKEGLFMVKNSEGLWEIYTADEKPKKIGSEYVSATLFNNGKALVAEQNKHVSIINTEGKVLKELNKIDGKEVGQVRAFSEGYAVYKTGDYYGVINGDGKSVIKAEYACITDCSDGKFIAIDKKYEKEYKADSLEAVKFFVLDNSGKKLFEISGNKYCAVGSFKDGLLPVGTKSEGEMIYGLINDKNEVVVKPSKKIQGISSVSGNKFVYNNGDAWGLMNTEGETLIRAKYDYLIYDGDERLVAVTKKGKDDLSWKYIDESDTKLFDEEYLTTSGFDSFDGEHTIVKVSDKQYAIIDTKGKQIEKLPDMIEVGEKRGDDVVKSDYVDMDALLKQLNLSKEGVDKISFATKPKDAVDTLQEHLYWGDDKHKVTDPYWYDYQSNLTYFPNFDNIIPRIDVEYTGNLSRQTYSTKRVIDYTFGDYYWYHDERIPQGYVWNDVSVKSFTVSFDHDGILKGKLRMLFDAMARKVRTMGTVVKENRGAIVVNINDSRTAFVFLEEDKVTLRLGSLGNAESIDIDKYENNKENLKVPEEDIAIEDSTVVDTIA